MAIATAFASSFAARTWNRLSSSTDTSAERMSTRKQPNWAVHSGIPCRLALEAEVPPFCWVEGDSKWGRRNTSEEGTQMNKLANMLINKVPTGELLWIMCPLTHSELCLQRVALSRLFIFHLPIPLTLATLSFLLTVIKHCYSALSKRMAIGNGIKCNTHSFSLIFTHSIGFFWNQAFVASGRFTWLHSNWHTQTEKTFLMIDQINAKMK